MAVRRLCTAHDPENRNAMILNTLLSSQSLIDIDLASKQFGMFSQKSCVFTTGLSALNPVRRSCSERNESLLLVLLRLRITSMLKLSVNHCGVNLNCNVNLFQI